MNFFEKIIASLSGTMETPTAFGWFHLMFIGITVVAAVLFGFLFRKASDKKVRIFLLVVSSILLLLEFYKQMVYSYHPSKDTWDYQWYVFPFQFCSAPMYVAFIAGLCKKCKFRDYLYSFLGTFCLLAGVMVMILPDVFTVTIGVNIQSMVHHGAMIVIGVVMLVSGATELKHKTILKAAAVFASLVAIALLFDCAYIWCGGTETCNMFFISPYGKNHFPVFQDIQKISYPLFLFCYLFAFTLASYIILLIAMGIKKLTNCKRESLSTKQSNTQTKEEEITESVQQTKTKQTKKKKD